MPTVGMKVRFAFPHHVLIARSEIKDVEGEDGEEDNDDDDQNVFVYHTLKNHRHTHMTGDPQTKVGDTLLV